MKKYYCLYSLILAVIFYSCGSSQPATQEEMSHQYIYTFDSLNKEVIFDKVMKYIANNFNSAKSVIDYKDKQAGSIVVKGILSNIDFGGLAKTNLNFILNIIVKDNKIKLDYQNFTIPNDPYSPIPMADYKRTHFVVKKRLDSMSLGIFNFINKKEDF